MRSRSLLVLIFAGLVLGLFALRPAVGAIQSFGLTHCNFVGAACIGAANGSTGSGLTGTSANGNGVIGQTTFASSPSNGRAGILGQDKSASGTADAGVRGVSTGGSGVVGTSANLIGVQGVLTNKSATNAAALEGIDQSVTGQTDAIYATSAGGNGLSVATNSTNSLNAAIMAYATKGADILDGQGDGNYVLVYINYNGDIDTSGKLYTSGTCHTGCSRTRSVRAVAAMSAEATLEDTGEAQLSAGNAYVHVDPRFANAIDTQRGYSVLITPEGETRGLYVTQRTALGFVVRENGGGRSTVPFAYRIVAHPLGPRAERLPLIENRRSVPLRAPGA